MLLEFVDVKYYNLHRPFVYCSGLKLATGIMRWESNGLAFRRQVYDSQSESNTKKSAKVKFKTQKKTRRISQESKGIGDSPNTMFLACGTLFRGRYTSRASRRVLKLALIREIVSHTFFPKLRKVVVVDYHVKRALLDVVAICRQDVHLSLHMVRLCSREAVEAFFYGTLKSSRNLHNHTTAVRGHEVEK